MAPSTRGGLFLIGSGPGGLPGGGFDPPCGLPLFPLPPPPPPLPPPPLPPPPPLLAPPPLPPSVFDSLPGRWLSLTGRIESADSPPSVVNGDRFKSRKSSGESCTSRLSSSSAAKTNRGPIGITLLVCFFAVSVAASSSEASASASFKASGSATAASSGSGLCGLWSAALSFAAPDEKGTKLLINALQAVTNSRKPTGTRWLWLGAFSA